MKLNIDKLEKALVDQKKESENLNGSLEADYLKISKENEAFTLKCKEYTETIQALENDKNHEIKDLNDKRVYLQKMIPIHISTYTLHPYKQV